jgi:6-phosphogluconate dehydrogenase
VVAFTQGFSLIRQASEQRNWKVNPAELARIWQGGCIIRAVLLSKIQTAFQNNPDLNLLMADPEINDILKNSFPELQKFVIESAKAGLAVPVSAAAYNYLLAINDPESPANLIQGLRDFFGAHTFERTDQAGTFHENWQN